MVRKYKNDYCFTNKDLFENMKWDKLKLPKHTHNKKHKDTRTEYVTDIFMYAFNLILLDIIENNATFVLPLFGNKEGCFYVKKIDGEEFKKVRQSGGFSEIDFLKTNFCGYQLRFQYTTSRGIGERQIHVSSPLKEIFINNINNGNKYY